MKHSISEQQMKLGRAIEKEGITTISQFTKAIEQHEYEKINKWKKQLKVKQNDY